MHPPGRFLAQDRGRWFDIGDAKAIEKTGQALREDAPAVRLKKKKAFTNSRSPPPAAASAQVPPQISISTPPRVVTCSRNENFQERQTRLKAETRAYVLSGTSTSTTASGRGRGSRPGPVPGRAVVQPKTISTGEGVIVFPNAFTNSRSPQLAAAAAAAAADVPPQLSTSAPPRVLRFTKISSRVGRVRKVAQQILLIPRDIGDDNTVHDAMVAAQQRKEMLFMDDGYIADSKHTILRDLFDLTEKGKPLELKYTYSGTKNTFLQLI